MDQELNILKADLAQLLRLLGVERMEQAGGAIAHMRTRIHDLSNDYYGMQLLMNEIQRRLGCEEYVAVLPALSMLMNRVEELERALSQCRRDARWPVNDAAFPGQAQYFVAVDPALPGYVQVAADRGAGLPTAELEHWLRRDRMMVKLVDRVEAQRGVEAFVDAVKARVVA